MAEKWKVSGYMAAKQQACCDTCSNYVYDEEEESYFCEMDLDEDEMYHFISNTMKECPYYQYDNEYLVVRHQM